ncbi:response regulator [Candidatus Methylospira mobilis]|uniref:Response regulator n=1 Tax=Candidatus Methylospira mobilis TaxID=1808979 RepID=A0A5Q0BRS6_9GAMM|nr:response regulator [Candidatus Methylospira mobilis]QFY44386.1 response regulator [Candidatus Methylospira mobilis]WNV06178.1 response regulator [Candidatus Methylospira mobilis]
MNGNTLRILLIEDDPQMRLFLTTTLEDSGWNVLQAATGKQGLSLVRSHGPNIVILDLGLPDTDGVDLAVRLRKLSPVPIIVVSARDRESDITRALDAGADDYLTKPFRNAELIARIKAVARRAARTDAPSLTGVFSVGDLRIDFSRRQVFVAASEIHLTPIEYKLLLLLARHAGLVVTHRQILQDVWGPSHADQSHYVRIYMGHLRHKLETDPARPRYILTEAGVGYRLWAGNDAPVF